MTTEELLKRIDHTLLTPIATWEQIRTVCEDGMRFHTAGVCIPPRFVERAHKEFPDLRLCTVIGFPTGFHTTYMKCAEADEAIENGAVELDMVISLGALKQGQYTVVEEEIRAMRDMCDRQVLKVIIETCLLTEDEKKRMCEIVSAAKADYIKTSTGFSSGGATEADVALMRQYCDPTVKIKAAGGISTIEQAEKLIACGADRIGTSRIVNIIKEML